MFEEATGNPCKMVCVSRDGSDWRQVETEQRHLLEELGKGTTVFASRVGEPGRQEGEDLSTERGWQLAEQLGMGAAAFGRRFDGTPGSLLLDLAGMRHRYEALRSEHRGGISMARLLDVSKLLHMARLPTFSYPLVRAVAEQVRGVEPIDQETWDTLVRRTREEGFAELNEETGDIGFYAPYLEQCVLYQPSREDFEGIAPLVEEMGDVVSLFFLVAFFGHDLEDYDRALSLSERAIELDPGFAPSWYSKSYSLNKLSRNEEALEAVDRALELDSTYHPAHYAKGNALYDLGRYEEALNSFEEALRNSEGVHSGEIGMYLDGLRKVLAKLGRFYEAISAGLRSLRLYPSFPPSVNGLCHLLCGTQVPAYALEIAEDALSTDPEWAEAWLGKGRALFELGREGEALEAYDRAAELQQDLTQEAWSRKGAVLLAMSNSVKGSYRMARVLTGEQVDAEARALLHRALDSLDRAIALGDNHLDTRMNRSRCDSTRARHSLALEDVDDALRLEPGNHVMHHNKGQILLRACRYDEALDAFGHAVSLAPRFPPPWWSIVLLFGGHFDYQEEALVAVNHYIRLEPEDPIAWFAKGCILAKVGRPQEARPWIRRAREHEDVPPLPGINAGRRRSALDFLGNLAP